MIGQAERKSGEIVPLIDIPMMSDERWQQEAAEEAVRHFRRWYGREPETVREALDAVRAHIEKLDREQEARKEGYKRMRIDQIRIYPCFAAHPPRAELMQRKESYYQEHGSFESEIILDGAGNLIDGYTSYLLAIKYGINYVPVRYGRRQIIKAAHTAGGKLYAWELPGILTGRIHPGDKVTVKTSRGFRRVRVAAVEEYDGQQDALKMVVRKGRMGRR